MRPALPFVLLLAACLEPSRPASGAKPADTAPDPDTAAHTGETALPNTAPPAPTVSISPALPNDASTLRASLDAESVDIDGDPVEYQWAWLQNGALVDDLTTDRVSSDRTSDGDTWEVQVSATDGEAWSEIATATVVVANLSPVPPSIHIDPAAPNGGDTLTLFFDTPASDPNGDLITQTIEWTFQGVRNESFDGRTTVDGAYVDGGESFRAVVSVTDGLSDPVVVEASVTVSNTAPEVASVVVSPADPLDTQDLTCTARALDADGGDPTLLYRWYRDGVEAVDVGDDTTVLANFTTVGETWECEVEASDGFAVATLLSSAVTIRDPAGFRVTATIEVTVSTDSAGNDAATGSAEWDAFSGGGRFETNDCSIYWSVVGVEDATVCRGCVYSFAAEYTYDAALSSVTSGCASLAADSAGDLSFENRRALAMAATLDDVNYSLYSYYAGTSTRFYASGSGGSSYSYAGTSYGERYEVLETSDAYGRTVISGYSMRYFYY